MIRVPEPVVRTLSQVTRTSIPVLSGVRTPVLRASKRLIPILHDEDSTTIVVGLFGQAFVGGAADPDDEQPADQYPSRIVPAERTSLPEVSVR